MRASVLFLVACTTGQTVEPLPADAGITESDADQRLPMTRCGDPPYTLVTMRVTREYGDRGPLVGARVALDVCPEKTVETDATGFAMIAITREVPYDILGEHSEVRPFALGRFTSVLPVGINWPEEKPNPAYPYDPNRPMIAVWSQGDGPSDACKNNFGLRVSIEGRPDARVHYFRDFVDHPDPDDAAASYILVDNLPPDIDVRVVGEKTGCASATNPIRSLGTLTRTHRKFVSYATILIRDRGDGG